MSEEISETTGETSELLMNPGTSTGKEKKETPGRVDINKNSNILVNIDKAKNKKKPEIEDIYQKKTQLEHILLRPDTYIGSVNYTEEKDMWVYDTASKRIVKKTIRYVPGLYKIFDEIVVNAADNKQRDPKMSLIKININKNENTITVFNNGKGVPVEIHKKEGVYVPELVFGTLLTSSNYDDSEKKITGGRNGFGAKLCNMFSKEFTVETSSKEHQKRFKQTWINSMTKDKEPLISSNATHDFTKVTFKPDLEKFNMTELDDDIISLMMRRAFDVAGTTPGVKVFLNGEAVPIQSFKEYVELHEKKASEIIYEKVNDRWEIACCVSEGGFNQVSFVNSIATLKGGTHADYVADCICRSMGSQIRKKAEKTNIPVILRDIKQHIWVFVNCRIENPAFDSQTKETLTSNPDTFGSRCEPSDNFYKKVMKCGIVESVMNWIDSQQSAKLTKELAARKGERFTDIPKLEDANDAGTDEHSKDCTLIVTEGDSAKTLAVSGLAVVGRDRFGIFPLRGKLLNVRESNIKQMIDNAEINALARILGLEHQKIYETEEDFKTLRYGKLMIMADQDQDGSHIKGLIINFIHYYWPSLIRNRFVEQFITPIIKAIRGKEELSFFSLPEFEEWKRITPNRQMYKIKYYKGLGTSTSKEAKEYFSDMARHRIKFVYDGPEDDAAVEMAFSRKKVDERKEWLTKWMDQKLNGEEEYLYNKNIQSISYSDFVNKELILFSNADNERSIPSLVDGLKPGQRKVIFSCFKRADKGEVKVAQLAGSVGELSAYHHGEASLMGTIVNLAQDFVGSNNVNLLLPVGQFGTRLQGGKDSASPRYIFTKLNPLTRVLFPQEDENVLRFLYEDNQQIEPEYYCPIIPIVLVNGASGIGTGWSTSIPNYNPREVVENIRRLIKEESQVPLKPWYKGYTGQIVQVDSNHFVCVGEAAALDDYTIEITELPIKTWTQPYKEKVIASIIEKAYDKLNRSIASFKEYHTDTSVRFVCTFRDALDDEVKSKLHAVFKLLTVINTTSMVLFDASGSLRRFDSPEQICAEFFAIRKQKYIERKAFLEGMLKAQSDRLSNQARFIVALVKGEVILMKRTTKNILEQLVKLNFDPDPVAKWEKEQKKKLEDDEARIVEEEEYEENGSGEIIRKGETDFEKKLSQYDYLLTMPMIKLSDEEKRKLLKESEEKLQELKNLQSKSWSDLWEADLDKFVKALNAAEEQEKKDLEEANLKKTGSKRAMDETCPDPNGQRIAPIIDEKALKEKYDTMNVTKLTKTPKKRNTQDPKTPKSKRPKAIKAKKDEWRSDQSEDEEEVVIDDISDEDDDLHKDEVSPSTRRSARVGARCIANRSQMAEEVNDEPLPSSLTASSNCGEEAEVIGAKPANEKPFYGKWRKNNKKERLRALDEEEKEIKRVGKTMKEKKSSEDDDDSGDSVIILKTTPPIKRNSIFGQGTVDFNLPYLKNGPTLANLRKINNSDKHPPSPKHRGRKNSAATTVSPAFPARSIVSFGAPMACSTPISSQTGINFDLENEIASALPTETSKDTAPQPQVERRSWRQEIGDELTMHPDVSAMANEFETLGPDFPATVPRPRAIRPICKMTPSSMPSPVSIAIQPLEDHELEIMMKNGEKKNVEMGEEMKKSSTGQRKDQSKLAAEKNEQQQKEAEDAVVLEEEKEDDGVQVIEETPKRATPARGRKPRHVAAEPEAPANVPGDKKEEEEKKDEGASDRRTSGRRVTARRRFPGDESGDEAEDVEKTPAGRPRRKVTKKA